MAKKPAKSNKVKKPKKPKVDKTESKVAKALEAGKQAKAERIETKAKEKEAKKVDPPPAVVSDTSDREAEPHLEEVEMIEDVIFSFDELVEDTLPEDVVELLNQEDAASETAAPEVTEITETTNRLRRPNMIPPYRDTIDPEPSRGSSDRKRALVFVAIAAALIALAYLYL